MDTLSILGNVQIDRSVAFPAKFVDNPLRAITLSALQRRNAVLDAVFYDIKVVTPEETPDLAFWLAREGAILVVLPSGQGQLRLFLTPKDFFDDGAAVAALAVAGVGSSALGAAAFARNVADALGEPVAAVVSGYGLSDVLTEAMGGFFWFGGLNSLRHMFEPLDTVSKMFSQTEQTLELGDGLAFARTSKDTETVIALLEDARLTARLLVGHSKGNLVISEALYAIAAERPARAKVIAAQSRINTISAKIGMPPFFHDVLDVIGEWDWFGALNSRPDLRADFTVPHAWHSTNPDFPMDMGIDDTATLKKVLPMFAAPPKPSEAMKSVAVLDLPQQVTARLRAAFV
jgi:hypothetical protein